MESCGRRLEVECGDAAIQGGHPAEQIAFAGFALCSQATGFRLDFLRLLDPLGRESVVPQKSMSHAIGGIFKWILAEVEWFAGAFQVVERALLHSLANPAIGNELKDIHETSLAARRSAQWGAGTLSAGGEAPRGYGSRHDGRLPVRTRKKQADGDRGEEYTRTVEEF